MAINTEITRISNAKSDIKTAIEAKGVSVPSNALIDTYDDYVAAIPSGGGNQDKPYVSGIDLTGYPNNTIEAERFKGYTKLVSVEFGTINTIGESSFEGCTTLANAIIPGLTSSGKNAFKGCTDLFLINVPGLTTIPEGMFDGDPISNWLNQGYATSVGKNAFRDAKLTTLNMSSMTSLDDGAFNYDLTSDNDEVTIIVPSTPPTLGTNSLPTPIKEIQVPYVADIQTYTNNQDWAGYANKLVSYEQTVFKWDFGEMALNGDAITWDAEPSFTFEEFSYYGSQDVPQIYSCQPGSMYLYDDTQTSPTRYGLYENSNPRGIGFRQLFAKDIILVKYNQRNSGGSHNLAWDHNVDVVERGLYDVSNSQDVFMVTTSGSASFTFIPRYNFIDSVEINPIMYHPFAAYCNYWSMQMGTGGVNTITIDNKTLNESTCSWTNGMYFEGTHWGVAQNGLYNGDTHNRRWCGFDIPNHPEMYQFRMEYSGVNPIVDAYNLTLVDSGTGYVEYQVVDNTEVAGFLFEVWQPGTEGRGVSWISKLVITENNSN